MRKTRFFIFFVYVIIFSQTAVADDMIWSAGGDGSTWTDTDNWFPADIPTSIDDVVIDATGSTAVCSGTFEVKSITVGGHQASQLTVQNFIYGDIKPSVVTDNAITNRRGGTIILQGGGGVVTVSGKYEDSETSFSAEPSFLFWTG